MYVQRWSVIFDGQRKNGKRKKRGNYFCGRGEESTGREKRNISFFRTNRKRVQGEEIDTGTRNTTVKLVGDKRKRSLYTLTESVFLEQEFGKGNLDTKEGRQTEDDIFTKETGEKFDVERIKT